MCTRVLSQLLKVSAGILLKDTISMPAGKDCVSKVRVQAILNFETILHAVIQSLFFLLLLLGND